METSIINLLSLVAAKTGFPPNLILLMFIIGMLIIGYRYVLKPMFEKLKTVPTEEKIKIVIKESTNIDNEHLSEISKKLDNISSTLHDVESAGKLHDMNINELKDDVDVIKHILSQFQGHLMYSNSNNFGNKELR